MRCGNNLSTLEAASFKNTQNFDADNNFLANLISCQLIWMTQVPRLLFFSLGFLIQTTKKVSLFHTFIFGSILWNVIVYIVEIAGDSMAASSEIDGILLQ